MMINKWIPEAPNYLGTYSAKSFNEESDSANSTRDPYKARAFNTKEECQIWCNENPMPSFFPVQHGFEIIKTCNNCNANNEGHCLEYKKDILGLTIAKTIPLICIYWGLKK